MYLRTGRSGERRAAAVPTGFSSDGGREAERSYLVPLLDPRQRFWYTVLTGAWLLALVHFWQWWLSPEHNIGTIRFAITTFVVGVTTLLPLYFIPIIYNGRVCSPRIALPRDLRVAMVVTKAPSEPSVVVCRTLQAMLDQAYPHDTWLADEDPTDEMIAWCEEHGVRISTRKGRPDYHCDSWPRRTRCKEGNLAFFYDHYGYGNYDFVVQLDADHVPQPGYLEEMLRPFADPKVGYVSAPSICDKNASDSWSARGRLYVEGPLHGPLQAGYTGGLAPLCIGSHYAVRTRALKQIGGLGPELAEDHSTTLLMNAHGWRGVHALNAIANGDGPATFADFATQEFQWSRSLMTILLNHTPKYIGMLPWRLRFQFLFCQLWYPLFCILMLAMFVLPLAALFLDANLVGVTFPDFVVHFVPMSLVLLVLAFWWRAQGWTRPVNTKIFGWEGMLFPFARWPWALLGILAAVWDTVSGATADFRVTPKGTEAAAPLPLTLLAPYAALAILSAAPVLLLDTVEVARGFYVFATVNAALYAILLSVIVHRHVRENPIKRRSVPASRSSAMAPRFAAAAIVAVVLVFAATGADQKLRQGASALLWGADCLFEACRSQTARTGPSENRVTFYYQRKQGG